MYTLSNNGPPPQLGAPSPGIEVTEPKRRRFSLAEKLRAQPREAIHG
jgi:hypothetical protein